MSENMYILKNKLESLKSKKGRHTELISIYISNGYDINKVINKLAEEQGTASNIKSKSTRKNVMAALEKIIQHLRLFKKTPENGLAVFCGNVAEKEGQTDFLLMSINPPKPLAINLYRCSQRFVLGPFEEMLEATEAYGIIVIDRRDADIAIIKGKRIEILSTLDSMVPGKFRAGGQSAARFERVINGMANDFYKKVSEAVNKAYSGIPDLKGILVGGPGPTKNDFLAIGHLKNELKDKLLGVVDIGYTGETGIEELLTKSEDILKEAEILKEKKIVEEFLLHLSKDSGLAFYGENEVREALSKGNVKTLLISENIDKIGQPVGQSIKKKSGQSVENQIGKSKMEELTEIAEQSGAVVEIISTETREGQQILNLGGIAAILRYKMR